MELTIEAIEIVVFFVIVFLSVCIVVYFFVIQKRTLLAHSYKVKAYKNTLVKHSKDIAYRQDHLKRYDFLKHNLKEVLVPQLHIKIE